MTAALQDETVSTPLSRCVGDTDGFLEHFWGHAPLCRRAGDASRFAPLLSFPDIDVILSTMPLRLPWFSMVQDGRALDPRGFTVADRGTDLSGAPDLLAISDRFRGGATLILYRLNVWWPPLVRFCRLLELELSHPVTAAAFLTPARSQGLEVHRDDQEVFVLQTVGSKEWSVWAPASGPGAGTGPVDREALGNPMLTVELEPGDCLYVPRGFPHVAVGREETSLHISVGAHPVTYRDLLRRAVDALSTPDLDEGLPPGFDRGGEHLAPEVRRRLRELGRGLEGVDPDQLLAGLHREHRSRRGPLLDGHLSDVASLHLVDDTTVVRRRPGAFLQLEPDGPGLPGRALVNHRRFSVSPQEAGALRQVDDLARFSVGDLDRHLDGEGRQELVRKLLQVGFLERVS
ncbi:MAG: JmjC domain-containing protein [Acidimicrobiia bacterium]